MAKRQMLQRAFFVGMFFADDIMYSHPKKTG